LVADQEFVQRIIKIAKLCDRQIIRQVGTLL
jgi:hypothetical protein